MHTITGDILPDETVPQLVRRIKQLTGGTTYQPRWGETIQSIAIGSDKITMKIDKITTEDKPSGGWEVIAHGVKLVSIQIDAQSDFLNDWVVTDLVFWDDDFTPYEMATPVNPRRLEANYQAQKEWEDDAYRWGNGSRFGQRDSADRRFQGYDYKSSVFYETATRKK